MPDYEVTFHLAGSVKASWHFAQACIEDALRKAWSEDLGSRRNHNCRSVEVHTVDDFQGREADLVVVCIARSSGLLAGLEKVGA